MLDPDPDEMNADPQPWFREDLDLFSLLALYMPQLFRFISGLFHLLTFCMLFILWPLYDVFRCSNALMANLWQ